MKASCPQTQVVEALRDGRLANPQATALLAHLSTCESCSTESRRLERLHAALTTFPEPNVTTLDVAASKQRLLAAARRGPDERARGGTLRTTGWAILALTGGAVATLGVSSGLFLPTPDPERAGSSAPLTNAVRPIELAVTPAAGAQWSRATTPAAETLRLVDGALDIRVKRHETGQRLLLTLPDGELEDVGTVFHVEVRTGRTREVSVSEGSVALRLRGRPEQRLRAGQSFHLEEQAPPAPAVEAAPRAEPTPETGASAKSGGAPSAHDAEDTACPGAALFQDGVAAFRRGEYPSAASLLERFSAQCGASNHGEDAAYLRMVALARAGRRAEARAQAQAYLGRFPSGFRRKEAEHLAETD